MIPVPLVGDVPSILGAFFLLSMAALRFFWQKRDDDDERENQVDFTRRLIWERHILPSVNHFLEERAPELNLAPSPGSPGDIRERRFRSESDEEAIRDLLGELQKPMNDYDTLADLDSTISYWTDCASYLSFASSLGLLATIVIHGRFFPTHGDWAILIGFVFVLAIVFVGFRVRRLEGEFDIIRREYRVYQGS